MKKEEELKNIVHKKTQFELFVDLSFKFLVFAVIILAIITVGKSYLQTGKQGRIADLVTKCNNGTLEETTYYGKPWPTDPPQKIDPLQKINPYKNKTKYRCGYKDKNGKVIIPDKYYQCFPFIEKKALVQIDEMVVPDEFLFFFAKCKQYEYIDEKGKVITKAGWYESWSGGIGGYKDRLPPKDFRDFTGEQRDEICSRFRIVIHDIFD